MRLKYKNGDRVIITGEPQRFGTTHNQPIMLGRVVTIDGYLSNMKRYNLKGFDYLTVSESEVTPVTSYNETESLINEREWTNESYPLKQFILGIFAFILGVIGLWFVTQTGESVWLVNNMTGSICLGGSLFCVYVIRETRRERREGKEEFSRDLFVARQNDLMEL